MLFLKPVIAFVVFLTLATFGHSSFSASSTHPTTISSHTSLTPSTSATTNSVNVGNSSSSINETPPAAANQNLSVSQDQSSSTNQTGSSSSSISVTVNGQTVSSSSQTSSTPTAPSSSGIQGTAVIFPSCSPSQASCPYRLINQLTVTIAGSGTLVTTITPNANGTFRVDLAPGSYVLAPRSASSSTNVSQSYNVTVLPGSYSQVSIAITDN